MSDAGAGAGDDYRRDNVVPLRSGALGAGGGQRGGGGLSGGGGDGGGTMLEARVARLEADVAHIQRDVASLQADMRTVIAGIADLRKDAAAILANASHLATREWVGRQLFYAGTLVVLLLTGAISFAPKLQALVGAGPPPAVAASPAPAARR